MLPSALTSQSRAYFSSSHGPIQDKPYKGRESDAILDWFAFRICVQYTQGLEVQSGESSFHAFLTRTWLHKSWNGYLADVKLGLLQD